jgi:hypothetical protein
MNKGIALTLSCLLVSSPVLAQVKDCGIFVRDAFNTSLKITGSASSSSFHRFECSSEFKTHDEAINSGLSVGTVVYGVPLKVGGNFDTAVVDNWKKTNCSEEDKSAMNSEAAYSFIRTFAPEAAEVAKACLQPKAAIQCTFSGEGEDRVFTAEWLRTAGDMNPPVVSDFYVVNGSCKGPLTQGFKFTEGIVAPICSFSSDQDMVASLQTSRGACFDTAQKKFDEVVISGNQVLSSNEAYNDDIITFKGDAKIITNGYDLTINAKKKIVIEGSPSIVSYDGDGPKLALGTTGKPGGVIVLQSPMISGSQLSIANFGQNGAKGITGDQGTPGGSAAGGHWVTSLSGSGCRGGADASPGGQGYQGKPGATGGAGGKIIIAVRDGLYDGVVPRIAIVTSQTDRHGLVRKCDGSCGGLGGLGGDGGPGGTAGSGASGHGHCRDRSGAPGGVVGGPGSVGSVGDDTPYQPF